MTRVVHVKGVAAASRAAAASVSAPAAAAFANACMVRGIPRDGAVGIGFSY
jgi:hypothetical protein